MSEKYKKDLEPEQRVQPPQPGEGCAQAEGEGARAITQRERGTTPQEGYMPPQGDPADAAAAGGISAGSARPPEQAAAAGDGAALRQAGGPKTEEWGAPQTPAPQTLSAQGAADVKEGGERAPRQYVQGAPAPQNRRGAAGKGDGRQDAPAYRRYGYIAAAVICFAFTALALIVVAFMWDTPLFCGGLIAAGAGVMLIAGRRRREGWGLLTMAAACLAFSICFCIQLAFGWSTTLLHMALTFLFAGILFLFGLLHCRCKAVMPVLPLRAIILELFGFFCLYFGVYSADMGGLFLLGMFVFLAGLVMPVIGCAIGIVCLCIRECRASRPALACAVIAVVLPVAALLLTILLFSTGVWVIRLM